MVMMKPNFSIRSVLIATFLVAVSLPSAIASYPRLIRIFYSEPVVEEVIGKSDDGFGCVRFFPDIIDDVELD